MSIQEMIEQPSIARVLTHPDDSNAKWLETLTRFLSGDPKLTVKSASEDAVIAIQRVMIFLGHSTASSGAFLIDGDFGPGTNRGIAQFQFESGVHNGVTRAQLCYPCTFQTARREIVNIPDTTVDRATLLKMLVEIERRIESRQILCGDLDEALFHLNALHKGQFLRCRDILQRYGEMAGAALQKIKLETGKTILKEWVLSIIRQESAGIVRPRFEQHKLSSANRKAPDADLEGLRMQSMSLGLGQIMGFNYKIINAQSADELFTAPVKQQIEFVARFIAAKASIVSKKNPREKDFRALSRYYNGPKYEKHRYHEKLQKWFKEFQSLM